VTKAEKELAARAYACPRCLAEADKKCRARIPQYTPLGFNHPRYGKLMKGIHAERLALLAEGEKNDSD